MIDPNLRFTIVYACDNNFVPLLAASIKSLEANSPGVVKDVYVMNDKISAKNVEKLKSSFNSPELNLIIRDAEDITGPSNTVPRFYTKALPSTSFFRLYIEKIVPKGTKRVLYLDSDMIVLEHISRLWEIDLEGNIIAAVQDPGILTLGCAWGGGVKNYADFGYKSEDKYLNSGMLLIDLDKWVKEEVMRKTLEVSQNYRDSIVYADQYCINAVLANRWLALDSKWNHFVNNNEPGAYLLHYTGLKPIYSDYPYSKEYQDIFYKYLNQTAWNGMPLRSKADRMFGMVKQFLRKVIS